MNATLEKWNMCGEIEALEQMLACCGARRWAAAMVARRPIASEGELSTAAEQEWSKMEESDWLEAFACHPRIGERKVQASSQSAAWSKQEQSSAAAAAKATLAQLAEGNALYEQRFGFTYIVCATGKSAEEMLGILQRRLGSSRSEELREAAGQQRQILQLRLRKWMNA